MGLVVGSLFFQLQPTSQNVSLFFGAAFLMVMFVSMGVMSGLTTAINTKGVWYKHRDNMFYPAWVHSVAVALVDIPIQVGGARPSANLSTALGQPSNLTMQSISGPRCTFGAPAASPISRRLVTCGPPLQLAGVAVWRIITRALPLSSLMTNINVAVRSIITCAPSPPLRLLMSPSGASSPTG